MPNLAKAYIAMIAAVAAAVLTVVASRWNPENLGHFVLFFALAMLASAMKIRLPGFRTTISTNFVFILIGIALFSFGETEEGDADQNEDKVCGDCSPKARQANLHRRGQHRQGKEQDEVPEVFRIPSRGHHRKYCGSNCGDHCDVGFG